MYIVPRVYSASYSAEHCLLVIHKEDQRALIVVVYTDLEGHCVVNSQVGER